MTFKNAVLLTEKTYDRSSCACFRKTKDTNGALSNMAAGFPLRVSGIAIRTSEALYQACRFPSQPEIQQSIIDERSPMGAKKRARLHMHLTRPDWDEIRIDVMRWCLCVKLLQNWGSFGACLGVTGTLPIVEDSHRDRFWGAVPVGLSSNVLRGANVLGGLLEEVRAMRRLGYEAVRRGTLEVSWPDPFLVRRMIEMIAID